MFRKLIPEFEFSDDKKGHVEGIRVRHACTCGCICVHVGILHVQCVSEVVISSYGENQAENHGIVYRASTGPLLRRV